MTSLTTFYTRRMLAGIMTVSRGIARMIYIVLNTLHSYVIVPFMSKFRMKERAKPVIKTILTASADVYRSSSSDSLRTSLGRSCSTIMYSSSSLNVDGYYDCPD